MNRQKLLLLILVGILALALGYAYRATPRQAKVSEAERPRPAATRPEVGAKSAAPVEENRVQLELLAREDEASPGFKRDIFRFWQPAPKPLPPPPPPPPPPPVAAVEQAPAMVEIQKELARFTFLGFLLKEGVKTIFLSANEEIFMVKKGDRFGKEKRFLVTDLTPELLTIRQNDDPRPITVPLLEQMPLVPGAAGPAISPLRRPPLTGPPMPRRGYSPPSGTNGIRPPAESAEITSGEAVPIEQPPAEGTTPPLETPPIEQPPAEGTTPPLEAAPNEVPHD